MCRYRIATVTVMGIESAYMVNIRAAVGATFARHGCP